MDWNSINELKIAKDERSEKKESVFQTYMQLRLEHTFDVHSQRNRLSPIL